VSHHLHRVQVVGGELAEVFAFFKAPRNLEAITPPWLGFRVLDATDPEVREGTLIRYRLRLHGVPIHWESRITEVVENARFVDEQVRGPYRSWRHRHAFRPVPGGVEIEDAVEYRLPFGVLGRWVQAVFVRRELARIFDYRALVVGRRFPPRRATPGQEVSG
jgi:ligand-binding SRPBCC domain-containing protein